MRCTARSAIDAPRLERNHPQYGQLSKLQVEGNALSGLNTQTAFNLAASPKTVIQSGIQTTEEAATCERNKT